MPRDRSSVTQNAIEEELREMTAQRRDCALAVSVTLVVIGASLVTGWTRAFHSQIHALAQSIADDSFYYLLPAWRFKTAHFFTFDGVHPTYGFQPLWELGLVLAAYATPDKETFLRVALFLPHVLRAGTAAVLAVLAWRMTPPSCAALAILLAPSLYLLNAPLLFVSTQGKENALYALLLALGILGLSLTHTRPTRAVSAAVGLTIAGLVLARLTPAALLIAGALLFVAWRMTRYRRTLAIACGLPLVAWTAYAVSAFGTVFPVSGRVKLEGSILGLDGRFWPGVITVVATLFEYVGHVLKLTLGYDSRFWRVQGPASGRLIPIIALLLAALAFVFVARRRADARDTLGLLIGLSFVGTALVPILLHHHSTSVLYYYTWYVVELPLLVPLWLAIQAAPVAPARHAMLVLLLGFSSIFLYDAHLLAQNAGRLTGFDPVPGDFQNTMLRLALSTNAQPEISTARIGSSNSGVLGFFSDATVINLDGLANDDVVWQRRRGEPLGAYAQRNGIAYRIDFLPQEGWPEWPDDLRYEILERHPLGTIHSSGSIVVARLLQR
jgi:hypothetical protein